MSNSWGILGNPTANQIEQWKDMPYGSFKTMVAEIKKKSKGKSLKTHKVRVKEVESFSRSSYIEVQAYDSEDAISKSREISRDKLEWHEKLNDGNKYFYQVVGILD
jgi:hypothetical protein